MNYQPILDEIAEEIKPYFGRGKVADYIPALAQVPPTKFGIAIQTVDGEVFTVGDAAERFSTQSVSKLFTLTLAIKLVGEKLWERVGREPSGNPFNSLVQLEYEQGIPRNPFINAGAHIVTDHICSHTDNGAQSILDFIHTITNDKTIAYDPEVAQSEKETGHRNAALANFLKSFGRLDNDVQTVLNVYYQHCSLRMSCLDLARATLYLANGGFHPLTGQRILTRSQAKRVNSLLLTCGLYDAVGDFAFRVGLPAKSGVGGGIVAIMPRMLTIAVWSPELNEPGNSLIGTKALELFTIKTGQSIF
ncbi:MAG TPA: glutaminase [Anaerolineae bacterium]|nr:glutaminase [Anaerolineae bacterium]